MFMFNLFDFIFPIFFIAVLILVIVGFFSAFKQSRKNAKAPRITVEAKVITKRADVSHHRHNVSSNEMDNYYTTSSTSYFVTFEVESGDRFELSINGSDYGMIVEGDKGKLTFQGTKFISFQRGSISF